MSKCSVLRTWKSRSLYWTLLRPKYWAEASGATAPAKITAAATSRIRAIVETFTASPRADRQALGSFRIGRAVVRDCPFDFAARGRFRARAIGVRHRVDDAAAEILEDQVLDGNRDQLRGVERGIGLGKRTVDRIEQALLLLVSVEPARGGRTGLVVQRREDVGDGALFDFDLEVGGSFETAEQRPGRCSGQPFANAIERHGKVGRTVLRRGCRSCG